jgi:FkbM family methyltransferase
MDAAAFKFRPGTIDEVVYRAIVERNEYRLPDQIPEQDLIIDIGAHIGSFSYLCWLRGARNIVAFEADSANAAYAQANLANTSVRLQPLAVWRSDLRDALLYHSGYPDMQPDGPDPVGVNTGGGHVMALSGTQTATIALDDVIGDQQVSILKLDCEGSEYPILLTSSKLKQVKTIVGEYHVMNEIPPAAQLAGHSRYSAGTLVEQLAQLRFRVEIVPYADARFSSRVGNFFAYNMDA